MDNGQGQSAKQQIVERIKNSSNILVTLSKDASVDELSAALGLTIMLNNMNKHATAVVSGEVPPAIEFLEPGKTFENTVDSLRDFIIALDKEKADHLRYKVDGDVVKIFITPYRTTITEKDLEFSQGDYNVELVLALGVKNKDHLDAALQSHGRILHDATVATITCGSEPSQLGSIDWYEASVSSICEMLVSLSEALKSEKPLLDEQIATAFLTGIVAATGRFSNNKTSSKVMTMAAQLMAAGANQQLIAAKLVEANEIPSESSTPVSESHNDGTTDLNEGQDTKVRKNSGGKKSSKVTEPVAEQMDEPAPKASEQDGTLAISHQPEGTLDQVAKETAAANEASAAEQAEADLAQQLSAATPVAPNTPSLADLRSDIASASAEVESAASQPDPSLRNEPSLGGTLNATTELAAEEKRREEAADRNKTVLTHPTGRIGGVSGADMPLFASSPMNAAAQPENEGPGIPLMPTADPESPATMASAPVSLMPTNEQPTTPPVQTLADLDMQNRAPHEDALAAVHAAYDSAPFSPANQPTVGVGAMPLGDVPHAAAPSMPSTSVQQPAVPQVNELPPLPDFSTLPPLPPTPYMPQTNQAPSTSPMGDPNQPGEIFGSPADSMDMTPVPNQSNDPNQFKIPGQ